MPRYVKGPDAYTAEWYAIRRYDHRRDPCVVFGASEAAALCGVSKYATPLEIYSRKRGEIAEVEETDAMRMGKLLEPIVLGEYLRDQPYYHVTDIPMLVLDEYRYLGATLDMVCWDESDKGSAAAKISGWYEKGWPVDAKTTSFRRAEEFGEEGTDEIPDDYIMQLQQQMLVTGCKWADLAVLLDGRTMRRYRVMANDRLQEGIINAAAEMIERITLHDPPEPTYHHGSTNKLLKELYGLRNDVEVILSDETALFWHQHEKLGAEIKEREAEQKTIKNHVLHALGDASIGLLPDGSQLVRAERNRQAYTVKAGSYEVLTKRKPKKEKRA